MYIMQFSGFFIGQRITFQRISSQNYQEHYTKRESVGQNQN